MAQRIEFKVGFFITITSLLIMASVGYVAYQKGVFSKVYTYTLSSKTGENLTEGMPVTVWGFTIGRVDSLELNDQGIVLIRIRIPERHIRMIRADSKFVLDKPLIGTPRIIVTTVNLNGPPLSPQTVPEITESNDINEIIKRAQPIVDKADRIMANFAQITENLADPEGDVNRILRDADALIARFSRKESLLEMAVGDPESVKSIHEALQKLRDIAVRADGILQRVNAMAGKTDEELYGRDGVLPQVRNILRDLLMKLAKINATLDNIHKVSFQAADANIDATLDNIRKVSSEAADATKDLRALRNGLDETVTAIGNLADEIDRKIPFRTQPEIRLP
ncbi:MAG: MCE family protein [Deltaproteobacteria bacterium]|nr:MCE family protein [Deltaproteobacteria bacterium]